MSSPLPEQITQVLTPEGKVVGEVPDLPPEQLVSWYRWMLLGRVFSDRMVALQRQGRMGTFGPINGQEAASIAIAAPLQREDWLSCSYREALTYMIKGISMQGIMGTWKGYIASNYPREYNCLPIQVVLGTQMLHAVGLAMAIKYEGKPHVAVGVCGDGATSEGDFNEALNFAGVFQAPVVIVVQNNGWAISTPRKSQTAARYIAHRAPGFGLPGHLVDGNDILASYKVMADCVERARAGDGPSLIEMVTYRMAAHTTADDPTKYRPPEDLDYWRERDPITRFRRFLLDQNLLTVTEDEQLHEDVTAEVQHEVEVFESQPPQDPAVVFEYTYAEPTPQHLHQRETMLQQPIPEEV